MAFIELIPNELSINIDNIESFEAGSKSQFITVIVMQSGDKHKVPISYQSLKKIIESKGGAVGDTLRRIENNQQVVRV